MQSPGSLRPLLTRLACLAAVVCLPPGCAAEKDESAHQAETRPGAASRVIVDQETGRVRAPTEAELERIRGDDPESVGRDPLRAVRGEDGVVRLQVPLSRYPKLEAREDAEGELETRHRADGEIND